MILCHFDGGTCRVCGAAQVNARQVCKSWRPGVGDLASAALSAVGVTKERVSSVVGGDCGCEQRKQWLNQVGYRLGIGSPPAADFHDQTSREQSEA